MRRLVASAALLLAVVAVPTAAHAATPLDPVPITMGTYSGWSTCDTGWGCGADLQLIGRFAVDTGTTAYGSIQTTAHLEWHGDDDGATAAGTITSPRFAGPCEVRRQSVSVDPVVGVSHSIGVHCQVTIDGGAAYGTLIFSYTALPVGDGSASTSGNFFTTDLYGPLPI